MSGVYTLLYTGRLRPDHPDHPGSMCRHVRPCPALSQTWLDTSCLGHLESMHYTLHKEEPLFTNKTNRFSGCLDYVWHTPAHFTVVSSLPLPYSGEAAAARFPAIPNQDYPSDHLAMGCTLQLKPVDAGQPPVSAAAAAPCL